MPPQRTVNQLRATEDDELDRRIEQIMDSRLGVSLERRLDMVVDRLAERMGALMEARQKVNSRCGQVLNPTADLEDDEYDSYFQGEATEYAGGDRRRGGLQPEKFIDCLATVEEVLEFKGVPDDKRVQFVATRLRVEESSFRVVRASGGSTVLGRPSKPANIGPSSSGAKCFKCGEHGHRQSECRKGEKRAMFIEEDQFDDAVFEAGGDGEPKFDEEEEIVTGDGVPNLVVMRSCMTPRAADENWLRNNIFQSTCTIENKVCCVMIDSGSCDSIVSAEAVQKLGLHTEQHPKLYKLAWLNKRGEVNVSKHALITFSIGSRYRDSVLCDVVIMDACHLLLGGPGSLIGA
ncbi:hypothetical protein CRG98_008339 [Punica granatum]|uniref:CCHC-type domain-containing protein n=1 Tax=Punica granatum TaxID=22663 RepID=A0A2I0KS98_PUNGR|nr:hypothetical protein CRG98_008339 [Punica granatum]